MRQKLFYGVCTALVTPFLDGKVNYPMAQQLLRRQIDEGIPAVVVCGTTGEAPTLQDPEKLELFYRCKQTAGDRCRIIAGTGSNDTTHAIELSQAAEEIGVDALLLVSPYYNKATPEGLYAHYLAIAHAVRIPIILYNVPSRTGVDIPVSVYQRLSKIPNIVGVKEASSDITKITRIRSACGPDFTIWTGNDDHTTAAISLGAAGIISVVSNLFPEKMRELADAALSGDFETASQLQCLLQPLTDLMFCEVNPIPVKEAMKQLGFDCGGCRLPLCDPSQENANKIKAYFQA